MVKSMIEKEVANEMPALQENLNVNLNKFLQEKGLITEINFEPDLTNFEERNTDSIHHFAKSSKKS